MNLSEKEFFVQKQISKKLMAKRRKTKKPIIIALVGLVGSGKSFIAEKLAGLLGALIIKGDDIRVGLRKIEERYDKVGQIEENLTRNAIKQNNNVILDADFINQVKRSKLKKYAEKENINLFFIRVYCEAGTNSQPGVNFDELIGRIITGKFKNKKEDFFGGASSLWRGDQNKKGAIVKLREMIRRLPQHYEWQNKTGGQWTLKKLPIKLLAQINTANEKNYKREIKKIANKINKL
jgi:hypothetical protein